IWTTVRPATRAAKAAPPRSSTVSIAPPSTSIRKIVAERANTSAVSRATSAPAAARISALARVRFQTRSRVPAFTSVSAMASPIVPRPMKPAGYSASIIEPPHCSAAPPLRAEHSRGRPPCSLLWFAELQEEPIGVSANRLVEHTGRPGIRRIGENRALGVELESRGLDLLAHSRGIDAMQGLGYICRSALRGGMIQNDI